MHTTFASSASVVAIASFLGVATGRNLAGRQTQLCTQDDIAKGLFSNTAIAYDVTTFCVSLLGLNPTTSYVETITPRTTVYPTTIVTGIVTDTVTTFESTVTETQTNTQLGLSKAKRNANLVEREPMPQITDGARSEILRKALNLIKRQTITTDPIYLLSSACACGSVDPGTDFLISTAPTSTITDNVIGRAAVTTMTTVTDPLTTTTQVVNQTSNIISLINATTTNPSSSSWISPWTKHSWSTTSSSTTTSIEPISTTSTGTSSSPTVSPSGCPGINGTTYTSSQKCMLYQRICGRSYLSGDFYDAEEYYPSPELCTSVCDAENTGGATPCLGIDWNTSATAGMPNCRQLMNLNDPIADPTAIALILIPDPTCANTSISPTMSTTSMPNNTMTSLPKSPTWTWNHSWNSNYTWGYPTGTKPWNYNSTSYPTTNMTSIPTSSGTNPIGPVSTNSTNTSCIASTTYVPTTLYATLYSTITALNISTQYVTVNQLDTVVSVVTTTVVSTESDFYTSTESDFSTLTETATVTDTTTATFTTTISTDGLQAGNNKFLWGRW